MSLLRERSSCCGVLEHPPLGIVSPQWAFIHAAIASSSTVCFKTEDMGLRFGDPTRNPSTSSQRCTMRGCSGSSEGVPSPVRVQNRAFPDAPPSGEPGRALSTPHDREHGGALGFTWESSYQASRDPTASYGVGQSHPPPSPQKPSGGSARRDVSLPRASPWPPGTCQPLSAPVHESLLPAAALT